MSLLLDDVISLTYTSAI